MFSTPASLFAGSLKTSGKNKDFKKNFFMLVYAASMLTYYVSQQCQYQNIQSSSYYHYYYPLLLPYTETWLSLHSFKLRKRTINVKTQIRLISRNMVLLTKTIFTSTLKIYFPLYLVQAHANCTKNHYLINKNDGQESFQKAH